MQSTSHLQALAGIWCSPLSCTLWRQSPLLQVLVDLWLCTEWRFHWICLQATSPEVNQTPVENERRYSGMRVFQTACLYSWKNTCFAFAIRSYLSKDIPTGHVQRRLNIWMTLQLKIHDVIDACDLSRVKTNQMWTQYFNTCPYTLRVRRQVIRSQWTHLHRNIDTGALRHASVWSVDARVSNIWLPIIIPLRCHAVRYQ